MNKKLLIALVSLYGLGLLCGVALVFKQASPSKAMRIPMTRSAKDAVAVVQIYGPIYIRQTAGPSFSNNDADRIVKRLHKISQRNDVKAVVLRINSPGGSVAAVQEICEEVALLRTNKKIVVASMGDVAASGGYYIASQADRIIASPGTLTGSIGVILQMANVQGLFTKIGLKMETIRSGQYKDIGSSFRQLTPQEREMLQDLTDDAYIQFVSAVEKGRNFSREKTLGLADGRIYTGAQAKEAGLIDDFGNSEDAVALAAQLAGISGTPRVVGDVEPWEQFFNMFGSETSEIKIMSEVVTQHKVRLDYMMEY
jgi:protease IV